MTDRRARTADLLALAVAAVFVAQLLYTWAVRLPFPFDLEWMEGGMLTHAWRIQQGQALYPAPGPDFVPFVYPPGYAGLLAALGSIVGLTPGLGRAVSVVGTLVGAAALTTLARDRVAGVLAAALFLACYGPVGAFYDLVRPDGLLIGLLGVSIALIWRPGRAWVPSALFFALAIFVKHNAVFFLPAITAMVWARDGWRIGLGWSAMAVVPALVALGLWGAGESHMWTVMVTVPATHPVVGERLFPGAVVELAQGLPLPLAAAALVFCREGARALDPLPRQWTWGLPMAGGTVLAVAASAMPARIGVPTTGLGTYLGVCAVGAVAVAAVVRIVHLRRAPVSPAFIGGLAFVGTAWGVAIWMRAHSGGFLNVHIPAFWGFALAVGWALSRTRGASRAAFSALIAAQLGWALWTTPFAELRPTEGDRAAGDRLVETLSRLEGPVWSPFASWLPTYAGHAPQAHFIGLLDLDTPDGPLRAELVGFDRAIADGHWGAIVTSQRAIGRKLEDHYRLRTNLHLPAGALVPKTGWRVRLEAIHIPR